MSDAGFASLSPSLLARKGGAKPAMRPQSASGPVDGKQVAANLEDLGWNDMGEEGQQARATSAIAMALADTESKGMAKSPVRDSIDRIAQKLETHSPSQQSQPSRKPSLSGNRRAAFTLRLDQERHLKLRLACTVRNLSAQQLVTDALDDLLAQMPEIDQLAAQVLRD